MMEMSRSIRKAANVIEVIRLVSFHPDRYSESSCCSSSFGLEALVASFGLQMVGASDRRSASIFSFSAIRTRGSGLGVSSTVIVAIVSSEARKIEGTGHDELLPTQHLLFVKPDAHGKALGVMTLRRYGLQAEGRLGPDFGINGESAECRWCGVEKNVVVRNGGEGMSETFTNVRPMHVRYVH